MSRGNFLDGEREKVTEIQNEKKKEREREKRKKNKNEKKEKRLSVFSSVRKNSKINYNGVGEKKMNMDRWKLMLRPSFSLSLSENFLLTSFRRPTLPPSF